MRRLALSLLLIAAAYGQVAREANEGYRTPDARAGVARTLSDPHRDGKQRPKELVDALQLKPGMTVADIGTGVGYMLPWLSRAVGPGGRIIAEDIFPDFLDRAKATAQKENLPNVSFLLGTDRDTKLPASCCDLVLALDSYHHFDYPDAMLASIGKALRPGGRLAIVDYYKREEAMPNGRAMQHIRLDADGVVKEVESYGWRVVRQGEHNPKSQYIAVFEKK